MRVLRASQAVAAPPERAFAVLEDLRTADRLHPAFFRLEVIEAPWIPRVGSRTRLRLHHRGVGFELENEIYEYRRGSLLVERQVRGPFAALEHAVHVEADPAGSRVTEVLAYTVALGPLGRLFDQLSLRHDLRRLLDTRLRLLGDLFAAD